jgi:large subunit ribosomal protein L21
MLAVLKNGGKQYLVKSGDILKLDKINAEVGESIILSHARSLGDDGKEITITAEILSQQRDKKILIFKKKRRKDHHRLRGHRQHSTFIKINAIGSK